MKQYEDIRKNFGELTTELKIKGYKVGNIRIKDYTDIKNGIGAEAMKFFKNIKVYGDLLDLSDNEVKAILLHEVGHIHKKHALKLCLPPIMGIIPLSYGFLTILNNFKSAVAFMIIGFVIIILGVKRLYCKKLKYELEADYFTKLLGYKEDMKSSLKKLNEGKDFEISEQGYPSVNDRLKSLDK